MRPRSGWDRKTYGNGKENSRISTKFAYERTGDTDYISVKFQLLISVGIEAVTRLIYITLNA
jgi:hypothetical protein